MNSRMIFNNIYSFPDWQSPHREPSWISMNDDKRFEAFDISLDRLNTLKLFLFEYESYIWNIQVSFLG